MGGAIPSGAEWYAGGVQRYNKGKSYQQCCYKNMRIGRFTKRGFNLRKGSAQPFLRWAGSKRQLIPVLSKYWDHDYCRYVEPFAGSASLFFNLSPARALLGDINADLMATYKQVKSNVGLLLSHLSAMRKGRQNYLRLRAADLTSSDIINACDLLFHLSQSFLF